MNPAPVKLYFKQASFWLWGGGNWSGAVCPCHPFCGGLQALRRWAVGTSSKNCWNHLLSFLSAQQIGLNVDFRQNLRGLRSEAFNSSPAEGRSQTTVECHDRDLQKTRDRWLGQSARWARQGAWKIGIIDSAGGPCGAVGETGVYKYMCAKQSLGCVWQTLKTGTGSDVWNWVRGSAQGRMEGCLEEAGSARKLVTKVKSG